MKVRTLPHEEYPKLRDAPGPMGDWIKELGAPDPAHTIVTVVEDADGVIHGYWVLFDAVHAEPLYLDEAARHQPKVAAALIREMRAHCKGLGGGAVFGIIGDADHSVVAPMAERIGFEPLPGRLYAVRLSSEKET
jgi:hypothetical protein